jgi:pimeloyl-ACP methyl ester carboxylesterase
MSPIRKAYVDTSSGQLHFRYLHGPGEPLLLFHRTPVGSACFEPLMSALAGWRAVYAFDTPGFGSSFDPPGMPSTSSYAQWMMTAIDALAIDGYHLFGHHTGTHIAVEIALAQPQRCRSLQINGVLFVDSAERAALRNMVQNAAKIDTDGQYLQTTWATVKSFFTAFDAELVHSEMLGALRAIRGRDQAFAAIFAQDFPALLARVSCPVLAMAAVDDPLHGFLQRIPAAIPTARVRTHGPAGIAAPEQATQELAIIVKEFVDNLPASG